MALDFDYQAARSAGYSDDDILDGLQKKGKLTFDLDAARKAGYSSSDIISSLAAKPAPVVPDNKIDISGNLVRGATETFQQLPQLGYGLVAGAGAALESAVGEGGIATGIKKAGVKGYQEWQAKIASQAKQSDSIDYSYNQAKEGDFGAMVNWLAHGVGYAGGQGAQMLATAGIGAIAGKAGLKVAVEKIASGMVEKEVAQIAAAKVGKGLAEDQLRKMAVANVAEKIGQTSAIAAMSFGQEGGEIFGDLSSKAVQENRSLSGSELAKAFGATLAAGGLEFVGDKFGIDVMLGKSALTKATGGIGLLGRAAITGVAAAPVEGATEYAQTLIEEYGKGNDPFSDDALKQARESAALGALGGAVMGGVGGAIHKAEQQVNEHQTAEQQATEQAQPLLLDNRPDPFISFPDGTVGKREDVANFINSLPEDQRIDARSRLFGLGAQEENTDRNRSTINDILSEQDINGAIAKSEEIVQASNPAEEEIKTQQINDAWKKYAENISAQRDQEFNLAEQQRKDENAQKILNQVREENVQQANAITKAQDFDEQYQTQMQQAFDAAKKRKELILTPVSQRNNEEVQNGNQVNTAIGGGFETQPIAKRAEGITNVNQPESTVNAERSNSVNGTVVAGQPGLPSDQQRIETEYDLQGTIEQANQVEPARQAEIVRQSEATKQEVATLTTNAPKTEVSHEVPKQSEIAQPAAANQPESAKQTASLKDTLKQASIILDDANVRGNERLEAIRNIRSGENTLEDLIAAHPPVKEVMNEYNPATAALPDGNGLHAGAEISPPGKPTEQAGRAAVQEPSEVRQGTAAEIAVPLRTIVPSAVETVGRQAALNDIADTTQLVGESNQAKSWVIREKETGKVIAETFDKNKVSALNTDKYEAVPIKDYLSGLNKEVKNNPETELTTQEGIVVERYLGRYGKGMSELNAKAEMRLRNKDQSNITWKVEPNNDLGYDRFEVVGYSKTAEKPLKSTTIEPGLATESMAGNGMPSKDVSKSITHLKVKWLGFEKINIVQSASELPSDITARFSPDKQTEAFYDPKTKSVYLIADNIASPERAVWAATHEVVGHGGLRMLKDKSVNEALNMAGANKFVGDLAKAIQKERKQTNPQIAVEEALAELSAAVDTGNFNSLSDRYGVNVPASAKNGITSVIARLYDSVKRFIASIIGKPAASVSDSDVRKLVNAQRAAVETKTENNANENYAGNESPMLSTAPSVTSTEHEKKEHIPNWVKTQPQAVQDALRKVNVITEEKTVKQKITELKTGALKKLQYGILDQFAPIKDKVGNIPYVMARMAKNADGTLEAALLYGAPYLDKEGGMLVDLKKKGFVETMQVLNGEHDRFFAWIAGNRAAELKKQGRENLFTGDDISSLKSLNEGKMSDGRSREAVYEQARRDVVVLNKSILDIAEKSGLIDPESRQVWESDFYVPFYRVMEEGVTGPSIKSGLVNQKTIKQLKGGTNNINDLTHNMLSNWSTLLTASAKNRAATSVLTESAKLGAAIEADEPTIKQMGKAINTKAVSFLENGKYRWFIVEDEHLLSAISALEFNGYNNNAMKVMSKFKNYLTMAVTSSPLFKARNLIRDSIATIGISNTTYNPISNIKQGAELLSDKQFKADIVASGGVYRFGTYMEGNRAQYVKNLIDSGVKDETILDTKEKMQAFFQDIWDKYKEFGDLSENVNRAALYQKLRSEGKTHLEASFESRDLMDFGLSGAWAGVRALNQVLPFFNARLQGIYKLGRAYNDNPKRLGAVIGAVALASVMLMIAYKDDEDWKSRSDSDRNNYWWFKFGGIAYRIPKPFEIGAAGSAIEHFTALFIDSKNTNSKRFINQLGDIINGQLSMNPIPQVFRPLIDVYANKEGFSGKPIENMAMQRLKPEDRFDYNTSELARMLGKSGLLVDPVSLMSGTGVKQLSPVQIDSMIKGYFSGLGVLATSAVDGLLHHTVIDRGAALPFTVKDFAGSFAEELPANSSRYVNMMYETAQKIEQSYASLQAAVKSNDNEKALKILKEEGSEIAKYHMIESLKRNESKLSQEIKQIRESKSLTGEQKLEMIRARKKTQDQIAQQLFTGQ